MTASARRGGADGETAPGGGTPRLLRAVEETRAASREARAAGERVGLVPTLGWLHEGHLSLVDRAREVADVVAVSIYVNPAQFGEGEDYEEYPRDLDRDLERAAGRGVDLVFAPSDAEMYAERPQVWVVPGALGNRLDGASRPGHFRGVLTVVLKLFNIVEPDVAVFGRKDFQQQLLIRRMVRDLNLPVEIEVAPIVREEDGLAVSSRNGYLSDEERRRARAVPESLRRARRAYADGTRSPAELSELARRTLEEAGARVDYARVVEPETLETPGSPAPPDAVCAVAAWVGETRLIDNAPLGGDTTL